MESCGLKLAGSAWVQRPAARTACDSTAYDHVDVLICDFSRLILIVSPISKFAFKFWTHNDSHVLTWSCRGPGISFQIRGRRKAGTYKQSLFGVYK
jgi:hypothetical protein